METTRKQSVLRIAAVFLFVFALVAPSAFAGPLHRLGFIERPAGLMENLDVKPELSGRFVHDMNRLPLADGAVQDRVYPRATMKSKPAVTQKLQSVSPSEAEIEPIAGLGNPAARAKADARVQLPANKQVRVDRTTQINLLKSKQQPFKLLQIKAPFGTASGGGLSYFAQGYVFVDINRNGLWDYGEPGIPDVKIDIFDQNGDEVGSVVSDYRGYYTTRLLSSVPLNKYKFTVDAGSEKFRNHFNYLLARYFEFIQPPANAESSELHLGFALNFDALLDDLDPSDPDNDGVTIDTEGLTAGQWANEVDARDIGDIEYVLTGRRIHRTLGQTFSDDSQTLRSELEKEVSALKLNHNYMRGFGPEYWDLELVLVRYGETLLKNYEELSEPEIRAGIDLISAANGSASK